MILIGIIVVIVLIVLYFVVTYNSLVNFRNKVKDQWAQIDVLLKRRVDLIPNLIETVKGYANHEKTTLDEVISARNSVVNSKGVHEEMESNNMLSAALGRLMAVAESYPDLKANTNFLSLQNDLKDTEDKIASARQLYNDSVLAYKNKIEMFPSNIIAGMFGFKPEEFFEAEEAAKEVPQVKF